MIWVLRIWDVRAPRSIHRIWTRLQMKVSFLPTAITRHDVAQRGRAL
ncbi:UNVERIFIED_CONTAM: hypothetical protein GTU68_043619 [Idotea baltica]|nr:hypothetical protein [Idotea baltica]